MIEVIEDITIYDNPRPQVHSRHGIFPDLLELPGGELLALFVLGEAFESPNSTTVVSRSQDGGRSWTLQGPLYDKSVDPVVSSDGMKATRLRDGRLIAVGYRFYRHDPEQGISLEETGGILPGDDVVSFSEDEGRTWTVPRVIPRSHPELLEISGPCIQTADGDLLAVAGIFKMPDGSNPSGQYGVLFRSRDNGETWDDRGRFFELPGREVTAWESRICEMQPGRVVAITWAYDFPAAKHLPNYVAISRDNGHTWSDPINTGHLSPGFQPDVAGRRPAVDHPLPQGGGPRRLCPDRRPCRRSLEDAAGEVHLERRPVFGDRLRPGDPRDVPVPPVRTGLAAALAGRHHPGRLLDH